MQASKIVQIGKTTVLGASLFAVAACGAFSTRDKSDKYNDGGRERIAVLSSTQGLNADASIANTPVYLPRPYRNSNWSQSGGNASHVVQHLELEAQLTQAWRQKIGKGNAKYERLVEGPVAGNGMVFAVDIKGAITAVNLNTGRVVWRNELRYTEERSKVAFGGGAALYGDKLYVTSGHGFLVALDAASGREIWRYSGVVPFRGSPTAAKTRVFAVTHDNQMLGFDAATGELLWDQVGIAENAGMLGAASPAFDGSTLIAALSSGELIAMRGTNGRILWQDSLTSTRRLTPLSTLTDIDGNPVIDGRRVYAISHAGRTVAIDMRTGERSWEADIAGVSTIWVAGEFGYLTTIDGQVACLSLTDGRIRWVTQLQRFRNQEQRVGLIKWNGPILAGDRLLVTSSHGYALSISPYTGDVLSGIELPDGASTSPIVVDGKFIVLTDKGELVAYQ
ncbi:MAG: PQQ-binding-like beta-propeller repeat protein [Kordiimonadaceae bacterium]|nr:PQQ-binding-like beta-propeller repeat protein [Kordiimonadaceae bacterium]